MAGTSTSVQERFASLTQRVTLTGISWQTYQRLLKELGDQRASRLAYDQGVLEITMPSDRHETNKKLLERMLEALTEELEFPAKSFGSTTLNRADLARGAEPDSCYYIQHVGAIAGRQIDLMTDPPPDLVIEVDISRPSSRRIDIYQQLGVPEVWRYADGRVTIQRLHEGHYLFCETSPTFPGVSTETLNHFLHLADTHDDTTLMRMWRRWIRQHIGAEPAS